MRAIWKFLFDEILRMPEGAEIIHLGVQDNTLCLWALVDPNAPSTERHFKVIGTGHNTDLTADQHIGSVFDGPFVWHVFEDKK